MLTGPQWCFESGSFLNGSLGSKDELQISCFSSGTRAEYPGQSPTQQWYSREPWELPAQTYSQALLEAAAIRVSIGWVPRPGFHQQRGKSLYHIIKEQ